MVRRMNSYYGNSNKGSMVEFDHCFPKTDADLYKELAPTYGGGIVYVNPLYRNKINGVVLACDVNSGYPVAMLYNGGNENG